MSVIQSKIMLDQSVVRGRSITTKVGTVTLTNADGRHDFDFIFGSWEVSNRTLNKLLVGSDDWKEFPSSATCRPLLGGIHNLEEVTFPHRDGGCALRTFDATTQLWSIYWITVNEGLTTPVVGRFDNGVGDFFGDEMYEGTAIRVRYRWQPQTVDTAHWDQAFSTDAGTTWETNWTMEFTRTAAA
jgi:hypothetical protein